MMRRMERKRQKRESPLLEPLRRPKIKKEILPWMKESNQQRKYKLSTKQQAQWLDQAQTEYDHACLSLDLTNEMEIHKQSLDSLLYRPVLATSVEQNVERMTNILQCRPDEWDQQRSFGIDLKQSANEGKALILVHPSQSYSPKRIHPMTRLLSQEMLDTLHKNVQDNIQGDVWKNTIRSHLARPLSASTFVRQPSVHPYDAPMFTSSSIMYPYNAEIHRYARLIQHMCLTHHFRQNILIHVRHLAISIRVLRRLAVPIMIQWHRHRKAAARSIQRLLYRHLEWKTQVFRPIIIHFVSHQLLIPCQRIHAQSLLAQFWRHIFQKRQQQAAYARQQAAYACQRQRILTRWVAKTRVCLFVHLTWCIEWFRQKRQENIQIMEMELEACEASDLKIEREYPFVFTTRVGKQLITNELKQWRATKHESVPLVETSQDKNIIRLHSILHLFDMDESGTLDLDEFQFLLASLDTHHLSIRQIRDLFETLDQDHNGFISYQEMEQWWLQHESMTSIASTFLSQHLSRLLVQTQGVLKWFLGRKQILEKQFIKKKLIKQAKDNAKWCLLQTMAQQDPLYVSRCRTCGRRFGMQRDYQQHQPCFQAIWIVDTYILSKWIQEEKWRIEKEEE